MRMNYQSFKSLVDAIAPQVVKKSTKMRSAISVSERLALTIRFLATGESFRSLEYQFRISRRAISYIDLEVRRAIYSEFSGSCLTFPKSEDEWRQIELSSLCRHTRWKAYCHGSMRFRILLLQLQRNSLNSSDGLSRSRLSNYLV